ncbi:MAG: AAA family ATPase [Gammaproteobacteria bacterium]|nr:AAA family ATPase [Gammaproteobacteria bacterium]
MIIIINGSVGVGKTETAWELMSRFDKSLMLDGDYIGAVHPFQIYDQDRVDYLYRTLAHLIRWHQQSGYHDFIINYVFEQPFQLTNLCELLYGVDSDVYSFWLTCHETEQYERIVSRGRNADHESELKRYIELNGIMHEAAKSGSIGRALDTTGKSIRQVADEIYCHIT